MERHDDARPGNPKEKIHDRYSLWIDIDYFHASGVELDPSQRAIVEKLKFEDFPLDQIASELEETC